MRVMIPLSLSLALITTAAPARADSPAVPAGKAPEFHTILPPSQSPPLSAAQLAKLAGAGVAAPRAPEIAPSGVKPANVVTSLAPPPGAPARSPIKADSPQAHVGQWSVSPALGMIPRPEWTAGLAPKAHELITSSPADPATAADHAALMAKKAAMAHAPAPNPAAVKPAPFETREPASASSPAHAAKQVPATPSSARRPQ